MVFTTFITFWCVAVFSPCPRRCCKCFRRNEISVNDVQDCIIEIARHDALPPRVVRDLSERIVQEMETPEGRRTDEDMQQLKKSVNERIIQCILEMTPTSVREGTASFGMRIASVAQSLC